MREETFEPTIPIMGYREFDQAISLMNDSDYGLGTCLRTNDPQLAKRFFEEVQAGTIWEILSNVVDRRFKSGVHL